MTPSVSSRFKTKQLVIVSCVFFILAIVAAVLFFKKPKPDDYNQQYVKYIESYTSGTISKTSTIKVHLAGQVKTLIELGKPDDRELFSFSPSIKGKAYWLDAQTVEFRPELPLEAGENYEATFALSKVTDTQKGLDEFEFGFRVISPGLIVVHNGLVSQNNTSLDLMKLTGFITTSDHEDPLEIEKTLSLKYAQDLKIKWQHNPEKFTHSFFIDSIKKFKQPSTLFINWSGDKIDAKDKGAFDIEVPALEHFTILSIKAVQDLEDYALIQLSEPVNVSQDLMGLISFGSLTDLRFSIDKSQIKVYSSQNLEGNYSLHVNAGIENIKGEKLERNTDANIVFENKNPSVTISGTGTILPNSGKLVLPFEAINLKAVDVTIVKIYENNIPQFFQSNGYKDGTDLRRVAKPVVQKVLRLDEDKALNLNKKNRFTLDLDKLIKAEPGAMYRVTLGFRKVYNVFACAENELNDTGDGEEDGNSYGEKIDEEDDFWNAYNSYYPNDYRWNDRDNPCTPSYYTNDKWASRNLLASNIGLVAKRGDDNSMVLVATDLITAEPMEGVSFELLDYQNQIIHTTKSDADGMAVFELKRKPFLLIAKKGSERGYLKMDDGGSLPLSRFDVSGDVVQNGLKGFIYGERGVWRPGDSIYVSFILEDKLKKLPPNYPVILEFYNPKGQLSKKIINGKPLNGFYAFQTSTERDAPTGNWLIKIKAGSSSFNKTIKVETVMPNRLKIDFNIGKVAFLGAGASSTAVLSAKWLFGNVAKNLKAKVDVNLTTMKTTFKGFESYEFDNPTVNYETQLKTIFEGTLNQNGSAIVNTNLSENNASPGMLRATFSTKIFEAGGNFSIDNFSIPYHVYKDYYGIKTPEGDKLSGMLLTGKDHLINLINVDRNGKLLKGKKGVNVEVYKVQWRWWWEQDEENSFANFTQNSYNKIISNTYVTLINGRADYKLRIDEPEWGRYLILVRDENGGHVTGKSVYIDWPGWSQREQVSNPTEASMLSFTANKPKFKVGEKIVLTIPSGKAGRALISIENGSRVIKTFWTNTKAGQTQFEFTAERSMAPNIFANVTLLQPHAQTENDLPIRMYGVIPILVEDPATLLVPTIKMADKLKPEVESTITVGEKFGKEMTYTIAIVDEGLLDLTRFKTPDAHAAFYAKEGLGVKTWDLFDYVLGAWGGNLERILSIGGDGSINRNLSPAKANRFVPVVKYLGPFYIKGGESRMHKFKLPQYIGAVRAMVIAGQNGAYGLAEKTVQVKKPLMVLATLPRVIGPGEQFMLPVTVFVTESNLNKVTLSLELKNLQLNGSNTQTILFPEPEEKMAYFNITAPLTTGIAKVRVIAKSGVEQTSYDVELDIRNPNPYVSNVVSATIQPGKSFSQNYLPIGMNGTNSGTVEFSSLPPINLKKRLSYLLQYPHGCVEQTTSSAFPQLYLDRLMNMSDKQKANAESNVKAAIAKLKGFQNTDGGLSYWPGSGDSDEWGSTYASHFLVESQNIGYNLPVGMFDGVIRFLKNKASNWVPNSNNFYGGDLSQAYRLYVLALAKRADMAAMNRLRTFEFLSIAAKWRLAAAYKLAGQGETSNSLVANLATTVKPYTQMGGTYGSDIRDEAMILETLTLLGRKSEAAGLLQPLAARLGSEDWYSTQTTAYSLLAIAKFCGANTSGAALNYEYTINGKTSISDSKLFFAQQQLPVKGNLTIKNKGSRVLFTRVILQGQPATGQNNFLPNRPDILDMDIRYYLLNGKPLNPLIIRQGTDFYAEVIVKNPGKMGIYEQMALTQIFPSGWEIINTRLNDIESIMASSPFTYRDIRDDRVLAYFNLRENQSVKYKVLLNASYIGRYYLSAVQCEAMYNNNISASQKGMWVQVIK